MNTVFWLIMLFRHLEVGGTWAQRAIVMTVILVWSLKAQGWGEGGQALQTGFLVPGLPGKGTSYFLP